MFNKLLIGVAAACVLCVYAVPANAAGVKTATITKAVNLVKKTCDDAAKPVWDILGIVLLIISLFI
jgi:hypothetical protein